MNLEALTETTAAAKPSENDVGRPRSRRPMSRPRLARRLPGGRIHEGRRRQRPDADQDRRRATLLDPGAVGGSLGRSPSGLAGLEGRLGRPAHGVPGKHGLGLSSTRLRGHALRAERDRLRPGVRGRPGDRERRMVDYRFSGGVMRAAQLCFGARPGPAWSGALLG